MIRTNTSQRGFTLIEMIGVLAVIAILGAIVAPKIFDAIRDSKVSAMAENISTTKTAIVSFYKDTGTFPVHTAGTANIDLIKNRARAIKGWKGPYLDKDLVNPINPNGSVRVAVGNIPFDINGDGVDDYTNNVSYILVDRLTADEAKSLSSIIDSDADSAGTASWFDGGRVRTTNATAPAAGSTNVAVYIYIAHR